MGQNMGYATWHSVGWDKMSNMGYATWHSVASLVEEISVWS